VQNYSGILALKGKASVVEIYYSAVAVPA